MSEVSVFRFIFCHASYNFNNEFYNLWKKKKEKRKKKKKKKKKKKNLGEA